MGLSTFMANLVAWGVAIALLGYAFRKPLGAWWARTRAESERNRHEYGYDSDRGRVIDFPGVQRTGLHATGNAELDALENDVAPVATSTRAMGQEQGADLTKAKSDFLAGAIEIGLYLVLPIAGAIRAFILWPIAGPLALLNWFSIPLLAILIPLVVVHARHGRGAPFSHTAPRLLGHEIRGLWLKLTHAPEHHLRAHEARRADVIQAGREAYARDQEVKKAKEFAALMQARLEAGRRQLEDAMADVLHYTTMEKMADTRQMKSAGTLKDAAEYGTKTVPVKHTRARVRGRLLAPTLALYELVWVEPYNDSVAKRWEHVASDAARVLRYTLGSLVPEDAVFDEATAKLTVILAATPKVEAAPEPEIEDEPQAEQIDDETPLAVGRPPLSVLPTGKHVVGHPDEGKTLRREVESALADLDIPGAVVEDVKVGPAFVTLYVRPPQGAKPSSILSLVKSDDLASVLGVSAVRQAQSTRPKCVALQIQRTHREIVSLRSVLASREYRDAVRTMELPLVLGVTPDGAVVVADLARMPHLLAGGMPGGGKSSFLHSIILALVLSRSSKQVRLLLSDPKGNELPRYDHIPHMLAPTALKAPAMIAQIPWLIEEMERRYDLLHRAGDIQDLKRYNALPGVERLPYIVAIYDEMAALMYHAKAAGKTDNGVKQIDVLHGQLADLLARSRASGIHVVVATQRPSAEVLPGSIQGNIDPRVAMRVRNHTDSQIILGEKGAERLIAKGDALLRLEGKLGLVNAQTAFIDGEDLAPVIKALSAEGAPEYDPDLMDLLQEAGMRVDLSHQADAEDAGEDGEAEDGGGEADDDETPEGGDDDGRTWMDDDDWHPGD